MARSDGRPAEGTYTADDPLLRQVRDALRYLHDPTRLQVHPLALALGLTPSGETGLGRTLGRRLLDAIEAVRPARDAPADSHAWRSYNLLHLRYVEALDASAVQDRLSISKSEYHRDHARAVAALASLLFAADPSPRAASRSEVPSPARPQASARTIAASGPPTNLPAYLTSFVGREAEKREVARLLGERRLVTLTGAGGCGKTRLAFETAAELVARYAGGVWTVELAVLADPSLVPQTVALALGIHEAPGVPIESTLVEHLRGKEMLLILDNCEHLLDASAKLADRLLRSCQKLKVLATSREALGVYGETSWRVPSLSTPVPGERVALERLRAHDTVRLLVERAGLVRPGFALTEGNSAAIAQICWRLDGMPLAIELAAAQLAALSVDQLASRLDDRFRVLAGGGRTVLLRQQTLRGTLDWSHGLLTKDEQTLFRRLAVFAGGWRLEAAESVCSGAGIEPAAVLEVLAGLVRKSLVIADELPGGARYRFLETIRQYAWEKLAEAGEVRATRDRHKSWCLRFVEPPPDWDSSLPRSNWTAANAIGRGSEIAVELDNLRSALEWCLETDPNSGLLIARLLWLVWMNRGQPTEGRRWLEESLTRAPERTLDRALALVGSGQFAEDQGDFDSAERAAEEAVAIFREHGDQRDICWALVRLGTAAQEKGDFERARTVFEECLAQVGRSGYRWPEFHAMLRLGIGSLLIGDWDEALGLLESAVPVARALETPTEEVADSLAFQGRAWRSLGGYARARTLLEEAIADFRRIDQKACLGWSTGELGYVLACVGEHEQAEALLRESLGLLRSQGHRPRACRVLYIYGLLANRLDDYARGCRMMAVAATRHATPQTILDPAERAEVEAALASARAALGDVAFDQIWAEGQAMTLDQAVDYALST